MILKGCARTQRGVKYATVLKNGRTFTLFSTTELIARSPLALLKFYESRMRFLACRNVTFAEEVENDAAFVGQPTIMGTLLFFVHRFISFNCLINRHVLIQIRFIRFQRHKILDSILCRRQSKCTQDCFKGTRTTKCQPIFTGYCDLRGGANDFFGRNAE